MIDSPDTFRGVCNTPLHIRIKNLIPIYQMNLKPGTCRGVCNTTLPIPDKYLINTYLLNPIPGKEWMVCVGEYCIRPTNSHDHRQMIDPLDTFRGICNTPLPIRDKYLTNTYLLNLIPDKDWIVRIIMSLKTDTFRDVCNTPLRIRIKNLIPHWTMNLKPGTCWGVCNTPLPIRDKCLINTYLLDLISGKDWMVRVGSYCIRPTNTHDHGQMIDPTDTFRGVCNTPLPIPDKYLINMYLLNPIPVKNWIVCIGACCIRPTNSHDHGQMIDPTDTCWGVCNTPLPIRNKYLVNTYLLNPIPERIGLYGS